MKVILDGKKIRSKKELHRNLKFLFDLPNYYGENLDAFWDLMIDDERTILIEIKNKDALYESLGEYGGSFVDLLRDLESLSDNIKVKE